MQPRIPLASEDQLSSAARTILQSLEKQIGMVPNLHRTLAHAPAALRAYVAMAEALSRGALNPHLREQIAVATAGENRCQYCASAHTAMGQGLGLSPAELGSNLRAESNDPRVAAALRFSQALINKRGAVCDDTVAEIRNAGFGDAEIVEIAAHVGMNTFTNVFNNLARTAIDFPVVVLNSAS